jgi:predicted ATPase
MTTEDEPAGRPSLRIAEMAITNHRTFRGRVVLTFGSDHDAADPIVTLHGDNGAGKSNAIAALDQFFRALTFLLAAVPQEEIVTSWDAPLESGGGRTLWVSSRDRPAGTEGPTEIEVRFQDARLGTFRVRCTPSGKRVRVRLDRRPAERSVEEGENAFAPVPAALRDQLLTWIETPLGPESRPLAILDERRRPRWLQHFDQRSLLHPLLANQLFSVRTAFDPEGRQRWRAFVATLQQFPQFQGKNIDIQPARSVAFPEIVVEEPGKSVLGLDELSSGEQQLIVLYASVVFARTPIVAIQEPEQSLDEKNQKRFSGLLEGLIKAGHVDQILLESHVPTFDGERVLRFRRSAAGSTEVERIPSASPKELELRARAQDKGAEQRWVTRDGYTQLPEAMLTDLGVGSGAHVWFLKNRGRWGAWPEEELGDLLSPVDETGKDDE